MTKMDIFLNKEDLKLFAIEKAKTLLNENTEVRNVLTIEPEMSMFANVCIGVTIKLSIKEKGQGDEENHE